MQSEPTGTFHQVAARQPSDQPPFIQDGSSSDVPTSPPLPDREERGPVLESESEWSLSSAGGDSTPSVVDPAWLRHLSSTAALPKPSSNFESQHPSATDFPESSTSKQAPLQRCPEEMLFHIFSFLSAKDLLTMHMVSRRFHNLVLSPHAWISAFGRHFPGPDTVSASRLRLRESQEDAVVKTEERAFTRLSAKPSWATEYLVRTKLLRCLEKGRPALPFASASPGKTNRGFATLTFSSTLPATITHLCANFGSVLDKRLPNFVHGNGEEGLVARSDKKGKVDAWGIKARRRFRDFGSLYPGVPMWGLGTGEIVGLPNVMDLSSEYGMIIGEGIPDGDVFLLDSRLKTAWGRHVLWDEDAVNPDLPQIPYSTQAVCSVWIAKTSAIPKASGGLVGILSGSSTGIVSAGSVGDQMHFPGELTARWILCPGVPIIYVTADDHYSDARRQENRIWAVAVNALGEVFYLDKMPERQQPYPRPDWITMDRMAFETGASSVWSLVEPSRRAKKQSAIDNNLSDYHPVAGQDQRGDQDRLFSIEQTADVTAWLSRTPAEMRYFFDRWDMRRRVVVDFAGDAFGFPRENIAVIESGDDPHPCPSIVRYTRILGQSHARPDNTLHSVDWHISELEFGLPPPAAFRLTTSAIDMSKLATLTRLEDEILPNQSSKVPRSNSNEEFNRASDDMKNVPGGRARFIAVGTSDGVVYLWNIRALTSPSMTIRVTPVRIIKTASYEITSLALNGLILLHGGAEGLVQAWDPLASIMQPIRTISSRSTLNARRRAAIAAQQNQDPNTWTRANVAANAICLDPDPTVLRGVAAIGSYLRYWSYDSSGATEALSHSQRRKMSTRKASSSAGGDGSAVSRRVGVKNFVEDELLWREQELKEERLQEKQRRRVAKKFGADLLGEDATEDELIAYAKLLSQEHSEREQLKSEEARALQGATPDEIEKYVKTSSPEAFQDWQFASWEERFNMLGLKPGDISTDPTAETHVNNAEAVDEDLRRAIELSLHTETKAASSKPEFEDDEHIAQAVSLSLGEFTSSSKHFQRSQMDYEASVGNDEDMARALSLSLQESSGGPTVSSSSKQNYTQHEEDDLAKAIRLSLQEQQSTNSRSTSNGTEIGEANVSDSDFPALITSLPSSPSSSRSRGKRRAR